jgi:His/Glu/Gln/Arg/opine family amino acid ABC transporter permease subunit
MSAAIYPYWGVFLNGAWTTIKISALALLLGAGIGFVFGLLRMSQFWPVRWIAIAYIEVLRSIPPLALFFGCFFGVSYALQLDLTPFSAATIALTATASSLMAEVIRAGVESVGRGQWEAALSSGMQPRQVFRYVIWPQAIRVILPPSVGVYISTLKDSSVASVIGYLELTKSGLLVRETTGVSFEIFLIIAVMYFAINYSISLLGLYLERRFHIVL